MAVMTGFMHALSRGLQERDTVAEAAVGHVRTSVPDALRILKPGPQQLVEMAEAAGGVAGQLDATAAPAPSSSVFIKLALLIGRPHSALGHATRGA